MISEFWLVRQTVLEVCACPHALNGISLAPNKVSLLLLKIYYVIYFTTGLYSRFVDIPNLEAGFFLIFPNFKKKLSLRGRVVIHWVNYSEYMYWVYFIKSNVMKLVEFYWVYFIECTPLTKYTPSTKCTPPTEYTQPTECIPTPPTKCIPIASIECISTSSTECTSTPLTECTLTLSTKCTPPTECILTLSTECTLTPSTKYTPSTDCTPTTVCIPSPCIFSFSVYVFSPFTSRLYVSPYYMFITRIAMQGQPLCQASHTYLFLFFRL